MLQITGVGRGAGEEGAIAPSLNRARFRGMLFRSLFQQGVELISAGSFLLSWVTCSEPVNVSFHVPHNRSNFRPSKFPQTVRNVGDVKSRWF